MKTKKNYINSNIAGLNITMKQVEEVKKGAEEIANTAGLIHNRKEYMNRSTTLINTWRNG